jgi:hypothetical protein
MTVVAARVTCDAPTKDGRCGRAAFRVYQDTAGVWRGMCAIATHAWSTVKAYPAVAGTQRRADS